MLEFKLHHHRVFTKASHLFLKKNEFESDLGGKLVFYLELPEDSGSAASEEIFMLIFDQNGQVSATEYPRDAFSIEERPPHIGYLNKLVVDSLLHHVQARLSVVDI